MPGLYRVGLTLTDQAGNVTVTGTRAFRDYRPAPARVWRRVGGAGRRVALTFDDGGAGPWAEHAQHAEERTTRTPPSSPWAPTPPRARP